MVLFNKCVFLLRLHTISIRRRHGFRQFTFDNLGSCLQQTEAKDCDAESDAEHGGYCFPTLCAQFNIA